MAHTFSDRPLGGMAAPPAGPDTCAHPGCPAFRPQAPPQAPRWLPGCPGGRSLAGLGSHGVARWCPANALVLRGGGFLRRRGSLWTSRSRGTAVAGGVLQLSALCPPRHTCPEAAQASLAAGLQDQARPTRYQGLSLPVLAGCGGARRLPAGPLALPGLLWSAVVFHLSLVGLPCVQVSKSWEVLATSLHHGAGRVPASWPGVCPPSAPGA